MQAGPWLLGEDFTAADVALGAILTVGLFTQQIPADPTLAAYNDHLKVKDVCRYVRSKNAGPFWVTIDLFFDGAEAYERHRCDPAIGADSIAAIYGVEAGQVKRFEVDDLAVVKPSIPRTAPQGGAVERDMHSGQQYVPLLEVELG